MIYFAGILLASLISTGYSRTPCIPKQFEQGNTIVCVCNVTHCDDIEPWKATPNNIVTVIETGQYGNVRWNVAKLPKGTSKHIFSTRKQTITIDRTQKYQSILGFGGSFTDATGFVLSGLPQQLQDSIINDFFSEQGVEFNLNRLPIGGADFSTRPYTYDDGQNGDFNLTHFALQKEDDVYKIPYMKKAKSVSKIPQRFFGSPWSAPAWMKTNNEINHGGWLKGNVGEQNYKTWANYYVKFLDAYKANGLDIWGLTVENEPKAGADPKYEFNSLGFTKESERDFIRKDLGPALEAAGYGPNKLNLMIHDDQRTNIFEWAQTIYNDRDAAKYVAGTAYHWYDNTDANLVNLDKTYQLRPDKFLLNTEACNGFGVGIKPILGNWGNLEQFLSNIITDLNHWVSGWVVWNMVLNTAGGPNWAGFSADAPIIADSVNQVYYKQPDFYGLGHISKFIVPGSVRIGFNETFHLKEVLTTVALRPDGGVVLVTLNTGKIAVDFTIDDGKDLVLTYPLPANSIQTHIYYL